MMPLLICTCKTKAQKLPTPFFSSSSMGGWHLTSGLYGAKEQSESIILSFPLPHEWHVRMMSLMWFMSLDLLLTVNRKTARKRYGSHVIYERKRYAHVPRIINNKFYDASETSKLVGYHTFGHNQKMKT